MGYPDMMRDILAQARRETITGRKKALETLPIIDHTNGLYNRQYFDLRLDEEMARSRLYGNRLSLILVVTGFSLQQDHGNEDRVDEKAMKAIADIIGDCLTDTIGLAFLHDPGKFAIILPEAGEQDAALIADLIRERILNEKIQGVALRTSVVQYKDHESIGELIQAADDGLYENS